MDLNGGFEICKFLECLVQEQDESMTELEITPRRPEGGETVYPATLFMGAHSPILNNLLDRPTQHSIMIQSVEVKLEVVLQ